MVSASAITVDRRSPVRRRSTRAGSSPANRIRIRSNRSRLESSRLHPAAEDLGDAPRLRDAPARRVRLRRVEDLGDRSDAIFAEVLDEAVEVAPRTDAVVWVELEPGVDPGPDEPCPDRALMVRRVARAQIAEVLLLVIRIARSQRTESVRRQ